jgi:hypothetical protein
MLLSVLKLFPIWPASCEQVSSKITETTEPSSMCRTSRSSSDYLDYSRSKEEHIDSLAIPDPAFGKNFGNL